MLHARPPRSHWALRTTCYRATRVERRNAERTFIEQLSDAREPLVQARFTSENNAVILQREATRIGYAPASFLPGRSRRYSRKQISSPLPDIVNKRRLARLGIERASGSYAREEVDGGGLFVRTRDIDRRIEVGRQTTSRDILLDESL
jgi:hypothetical protein